MQDQGLIKLDIKQPTAMPWWVSLVPYALVLVAIILIYRFAFKSVGQGGGHPRAGGFGKARVKVEGDQKKKVFFEDVAGADEEKEELKEVVDFLKNPGKFTFRGFVRSLRTRRNDTERVVLRAANLKYQ